MVYSGATWVEQFREDWDVRRFRERVATHGNVNISDPRQIDLFIQAGEGRWNILAPNEKLLQVAGWYDGAKVRMELHADRTSCGVMECDYADGELDKCQKCSRSFCADHFNAGGHRL